MIKIIPNIIFNIQILIENNFLYYSDLIKQKFNKL